MMMKTTTIACAIGLCLSLIVPEAQADVPITIVIEAEALTQTYPMRADDDPAASNGSFIHVPNGVELGGSATALLDIAQDDDYVVWGRVMAPNGSDDSFNIFFDGVRAEWHIKPQTSEWAWRRVTNRVGVGEYEPVRFSLATGVRELEVRRREDGTKIDQLIVTNDVNFVPEAIEPTTITVEAESCGTLVPPMQLGQDGLASGAGYAYVPNGAGSDGELACTVDVWQPGTYRVFARVLAQNGGDNSFWVDVDGSEAAKWMIPVKTHWEWHLVDHTNSQSQREEVTWELAEGEHLLRVSQREDGTKIDQLVITNDPDLGADPQLGSDLDLLQYARRRWTAAREFSDAIPELLGSPPGNTDAVKYLMFATAAYFLDERVAEADARILAIEQELFDKLSTRDLTLNNAVLVYSLFGAPNCPYPGRMSTAAADHLAGELAEYTIETSRMVDATLDPWTHVNTENHHFEKASINLLTAQLLLDRGEDPTFDDGYPASVHRDAWTAQFKSTFDERARKGLLCEVNSPSYQHYSMQAIKNLYSFAADPALREKTGIFLDVLFADWAQEQLHRVRGGGKSRSYVGVDKGTWSRNGAKDGMFSLSNLVFGGVAPSLHRTAPFFLSGDYFPPPLVVDLANRPPDGPSELVSRRPGVMIETINHYGDTATVLNPQVSLLKYSYVRPEYIMGCIMFDPTLDYARFSSQNRWSGITFRSTTEEAPTARVFPVLEPLDPDLKKTHNPHTTVQYEHVLIVQKNIWSGDEWNGASRVYFSDDLDAVVEGLVPGWIVVQEGDAFLGVKIVDGTYHWAETTAQVQYLVLDDEWSPIIFEAGNVGPLYGGYADLNGFADHLVNDTVSTLNAGVLTYSTTTEVAEDDFETNAFMFFTEQSQNPSMILPRINGNQVNLAPSMTTETPFMSSVWDSGEFTLAYDRHPVLLLDIPGVE